MEQRHFVWWVDLAKPPVMGLPPLETERSCTEGGSDSVFWEEALFFRTLSVSLGGILYQSNSVGWTCFSSFCLCIALSPLVRRDCELAGA